MSREDMSIAKTLLEDLLDAMGDNPLYTLKGIGQFGHYHVGSHINDAHSMYIIGE